MGPRFAQRVLRWVGWRREGEPPPFPKYVMIALHTSNWDGLLMLILAACYGLEISWVGKHTLFRWPFGGLVRRLGGIPVDRSAAHDVVKQLAAAFEARERMILIIAPEGTRHRAERWKSGFYHLAREAGVPIVLANLDYGRKVGGFGISILPSGDVKKDMDAIRAYYADKTPCRPKCAGPILLREETRSG